MEGLGADVAEVILQLRSYPTSLQTWGRTSVVGEFPQPAPYLIQKVLRIRMRFRDTAIDSGIQSQILLRAMGEFGRLDNLRAVSRGPFFVLLCFEPKNYVVLIG